MIRTQSLNGTWNMMYCLPGIGQKQGIPEYGVQDEQYIAATVPGDIHLDLMKAGRLDDPRSGLHADSSIWTEAYDWWFSKEFYLPSGRGSEQVELQFEGLDTTADIWVNGKPAGMHSNMFISCTLCISEHLQAGKNRIVVRLDSGVREVQDKPIEKYAFLWKNDASVDGSVPRMWMRKHQYAFGWDWAPRLLTCGIWRNVELRFIDAVCIRDIWLRTVSICEDYAELSAVFELENVHPNARVIQLELVLEDDRVHKVGTHEVLDKGVQKVNMSIRIANPRLWWPAPMGEPYLYQVYATIYVDGAPTDQRIMRYGIREVTLSTGLRADGEEEFVIVVNNRQVFCKGANWVPPDMILPDIRHTKYRELIRLAAEAHFNMLRVNGVGIYEDPYFYELCDQYGIMIWQDAMYACPYYPFDDTTFLEAAKSELERAVIMLRNHASIVLWCGNNEDQWIHSTSLHSRNDYVRKHISQFDYSASRHTYEETFKAMLMELDPARPYWPSSPWGSGEGKETYNSEQSGDRHSWNVTLQYPSLAEKVDYVKYALDNGKFISEFGVHAPPSVESQMKYLPPSDFDRASAAWKFHTNKMENHTVNAAIAEYFGISAELLDREAYTFMSQWIQAEALKFAIEHWRRRKPFTSGALFWMYSDVWGEVGWTIVDYYLNKKMSYFFVRHAFEPVLTSMVRNGHAVDIWLINDTLHDLQGELEYGLVNMVTNEIASRRQAVTLLANQSMFAVKMDVAHIPSGQEGEWTAYSRLYCDGKLLTHNRNYLSGFHLKHVQSCEPEFSYRIHGNRLTIEAKTFVGQVRIRTPLAVTTRENYFDLLPGETKEVRLYGPENLYEQVCPVSLNKLLLKKVFS